MIARLSSLDALPADMRGATVAIGNFDGVHRGHQAVLEAARAVAVRDGTPLTVLTFEPHPRAVFAPDNAPARITPAPMKAEILGALGFDAVVEMPFTLDFAALTADQFIDDVLVAGFGVRHVVTGFDFHFGAKRQGGPAFLMEAGKSRGFDVILVDAKRDADVHVISSSRIREELQAGDLMAANRLLGYRYRVRAEVTSGERLGRTLGYPTANMALPGTTPLAHGIYAVRFIRAGGIIHDGVASFGRRPTVTEEGAPLLETFLFDFKGDLYGETCTVCLVAFQRGEEKFDDLDALVVQMKRDEAAARQILAALAPLSPLDGTLTFGA
ncbi:MAG: bifunctional riboflavin kinase/FAD synthetase [Roseitalea sp.]|jgi:riboflavin kinase/FMN adenylyltransferase|nr:bifunctional riboflavin kinase/FAD synthetase [Roseitalea sp.]MBO6723468.1 bifunctional riboflavin kinase/FAD synthetase [Roseitalea sp.]MBO6744741.1 bifunctional riboflavin kinase/FAD synthetase [Roseitalea sp.]